MDLTVSREVDLSYSALNENLFGEIKVELPAPIEA
jgi:hypothetical protein